MKISIITPTYNSEKTILDNAQSIINQTYKEFEHIIVDNLSTDNTLQIIKNIYLSNNISDKLRIICEKDEGISDAFNKGINASSGKIINILNSDDHYASPNVFSEVVKVFDDDNILLTHGDIFFDDPIYGSNIRKPLLCPVTVAMPYNHPTMFIKKSVYEKYDLYDTSFRYAMDFEFICKLSKNIDDLKSKSSYLNRFPIVNMKAGGASWKNELASLRETKKALKYYGFWNLSARKNYAFRKLRIKLKTVFSVFGMEKTVTFWRKWKWENKHE